MRGYLVSMAVVALLALAAGFGTQRAEARKMSDEDGSEAKVAGDAARTMAAPQSASTYNGGVELFRSFNDAGAPQKVGPAGESKARELYAGGSWSLRSKYSDGKVMDFGQYVCLSSGGFSCLSYANYGAAIVATEGCYTSGDQSGCGVPPSPTSKQLFLRWTTDQIAGFSSGVNGGSQCLHMDTYSGYTLGGIAVYKVWHQACAYGSIWTNQQWSWISAGSGYFYLRNAYNGYYLYRDGAGGIYAVPPSRAQAYNNGKWAWKS